MLLFDVLNRRPDARGVYMNGIWFAVTKWKYLQDAAIENELE